MTVPEMVLTTALTNRYGGHGAVRRGPSSALDPAGRREVLDLIGGMRGQATVILSSHILTDVQHS
jgi:hypothetical protein